MNEAKTAGNTALVLGTVGTAQVGRTEEESKLDRQVSLIEQQASDVVVASEEDFVLAGELTKQVKEMQKKVTDYWEPMRKSTYEAYSAVNQHKKEMLDPLASAEKILKRKMGDYTIEQERRRREQEEAMRKAAEAEKRALDNAVGAALERSGMAPIFQRVAPIDAFAQAFADGGTVYLHGPVGSGKTTTAAGIAKCWLYAHAWNPAPGHYTLPPVRFTSSVRILAEFKDSYDGRGGGKDLMERLTGARLLVIDDLGQERPSEWALERLYELADARYGAGYPTIVTSNYSTHDLEWHLEKAGSREKASAIIRRLTHKAQIVQVG